MGLLLTFTALYFQVGGQGGQPALCYLVPTVLGGTVGYAHIRGELKEMWIGGDSTEEYGSAESEGERLIDGCHQQQRCERLMIPATHIAS